MGRAIILKGLLISCLALINIAWAAEDKPAEAKAAESKSENTETKSDKAAEASPAKAEEGKASASAEGKGDKAAEPKAAEKKPEEAKKDVTLNDSVSAELKASIAAAEKANKASAKAGFEWFWSDKSGSEHVQEAIKLANAGEDKKAMQLAKLVELAGKQGLEQAEKSKKAKPDFQ
jgi:hypothetical protein